MTLLPQLTGKNTGGQGQKPAICPAGVWVGPCLWVAIYFRKSQGRRDSYSGARDTDLGLWKKGNIAKEAYMAEQVHIRS